MLKVNNFKTLGKSILQFAPLTSSQTLGKSILQFASSSRAVSSAASHSTSRESLQTSGTVSQNLQESDDFYKQLNSFHEQNPSYSIPYAMSQLQLINQEKQRQSLQRAL